MQDAPWREQQRRLLSAHFGPREVESLAMNAVLPLDQDNGCVAGAPLLWVQQREMKVCRTSYHTWTCWRQPCGPACGSELRPPWDGCTSKGSNKALLQPKLRLTRWSQYVHAKQRIFWELF